MKFAILGCSHSSIRTHEHVWSKLLADKYPHLDVDNFAMPGHGTFYMDMVLKHIMYEREENYDWILIQLTSPNRWFTPIACENKPLWKTVFEQDNYREIVNTLPRLKTDIITDPQPPYVNEGMVGNEDPIELGVMNESFYYTDLFVKQIQDMSKAGVPLSYFTFWNNMPPIDNIGFGMSANRYIHSLAKDELDFVENWLDDTLHLNKQANIRLLNKLEGLPLFRQYIS